MKNNRDNLVKVINISYHRLMNLRTKSALLFAVIILISVSLSACGQRKPIQTPEGAREDVFTY